ncbi:MAG: hypothetical protein J5666_06085 [Bacilli bacterium]|nr:hypothetical protein [Bacilli bacterium]
MYHYELVNNHYIVEINGRKYLLDTGCGGSLIRRGEPIVINGKAYGQNRLPEQVASEMSKFIGVDIDGLIGSEVVLNNGLTIYKNGNLEFATLENGGDNIVPLINRGGRLSIEGTVSPTIKGQILIDTGAKYGYGDFRSAFTRENMCEHIHDFNPNPRLGYFDSYAYAVKVIINNHEYNLKLGDSDKVNMYCLSYGYKAVINITDLFNEYCVFDINNHRLVLK